MSTAPSAVTVLPADAGEAVTLIAPFTAHDRCDRCGAQAYVGVRVRREDADAPATLLLFCGHHAKVHTPVLFERSLVVAVRDDIALLSNENRTQGSAN